MKKMGKKNGKKGKKKKKRRVQKNGWHHKKLTNLMLQPIGAPHQKQKAKNAEDLGLYI
jgi:hypothetical protein